MENVNFGIAKNAILGKLQNEFVENNSINEGKEMSNNFIFLIKESPILQLEFEVYKNLENRHIENDVIATRYIDSNLSLFENYTRDEVISENKKLEKFTSVNKEENRLYESINELILQATKSDDLPNVDNIHESFIVVLEHIKTPKETDSTSDIKTPIIEGIDNTDVINIAVSKFNERYSHLDEGEKKLLKTITMGDDSEKKEIFESLKASNMEILSQIEKNGIADKVTETIDRIENMNYTQESVTKDIISLYELKESLS